MTICDTMNPLVGNLMICHKLSFEHRKCEVVSLDVGKCGKK